MLSITGDEELKKIPELVSLLFTAAPKWGNSRIIDLPMGSPALNLPGAEGDGRLPEISRATQNYSQQSSRTSPERLVSIDPCTALFPLLGAGCPQLSNA